VVCILLSTYWFVWKTNSNEKKSRGPVVRECAGRNDSSRIGYPDPFFQTTETTTSISEVQIESISSIDKYELEWNGRPEFVCNFLRQSVSVENKTKLMVKGEAEAMDLDRSRNRMHYTLLRAFGLPVSILFECMDSRDLPDWTRAN